MIETFVSVLSWAGIALLFSALLVGTLGGVNAIWTKAWKTEPDKHGRPKETTDLKWFATAIIVSLLAFSFWVTLFLEGGRALEKHMSSRIPTPSVVVSPSVEQ